MLNTKRTLVPPLLSTSVGFGATLTEYFGSPPSGFRKCIRISVVMPKCSDSEEHNAQNLGNPSVAWYLMVFEGIGRYLRETPVGTTFIEYFGSPSLELRNGMRINILELK